MYVTPKVNSTIASFLWIDEDKWIKGYFLLIKIANLQLLCYAVIFYIIFTKIFSIPLKHWNKIYFIKPIYFFSWWTTSFHQKKKFYPLSKINF